MKRLFLWLLLCIALPAAAQMNPIAIAPDSTITISVTSSSATTILPTAGVDTLRQLEIQNAGTITVFVQPGISTVTATTAASYPILPGQSKVVTIARTATHIAAIATSGTQTLYVSVGVGE